MRILYFDRIIGRVKLNHGIWDEFGLGYTIDDYLPQREDYPPNGLNAALEGYDVLLIHPMRGDTGRIIDELPVKFPDLNIGLILYEAGKNEKMDGRVTLLRMGGHIQEGFDNLKAYFDSMK